MYNLFGEKKKRGFVEFGRRNNKVIERLEYNQYFMNI